VSGRPEAKRDWYKDAIIYELHVRSFSDANADGCGDFAGLRQKLDYLADLGVTALWLLPFYPSPLRDGGYDIADYYGVHPSYGSLEEFKQFLAEAHARGLYVITELVINHTSSDHPWFQRARTSEPGSPARDFYVWSERPDRYQDARIIFKDFEVSNWTWDPIAQSYFWHRFYSHQPDLNFDNPAVQTAIMQVLDFWLGLGVDGLRLDAVPYLFEREGTNSENLPETHAFLRALRAHVDAHFENRMLLAEANQWPLDAAAYFGNGDECHMNFHFPLMPRLFMALDGEDAFPVIDILHQTPMIPESCQWATFLRNHDELTLEMVTDEDRDYMYRVYALDERARINLGIRRRLFPLLRERRRVELLTGLLFTLPGTPVLYYGDEIGMGDNIYLGDRDGVRTPMQWSSQRNAGFSDASPQRLFLPLITEPEYHFQAINVEVQQQNPSSLLWWTKQLIALRKLHPVFGRGTLEFLTPANNKVLAFIRADGAESVLVVANLSRFAQATELDLAQYQGHVPIELRGRSRFPEIGADPYRLTLGPHDLLLLDLASSERASMPTTPLSVHGSWRNLTGSTRHELANRLYLYAREHRWYRSKAATVSAVTIDDFVPLDAGSACGVVLLGVEHPNQKRETYLIPLHFEPDGAAAEPASKRASPIAQLAILEPAPGEAAQGTLEDAVQSRQFGYALLEAFRSGAAIESGRSVLHAQVFDGLAARLREPLEPRVASFEQSNSMLLFGSSLILKLLRVLEEGESVELELARFLEKTSLPRPPPRAVGALVLETRGKSVVIGLLHEYIDNRGSAWTLALDTLSSCFERALTLQPFPDAIAPPSNRLFPRAVPAAISELCSPFFTQMTLLAQRTAELHLALASSRDDPAFCPEPIEHMHQHSLYQTAHASLARLCGELRYRSGSFEPGLLERIRTVLAAQSVIDARLRRIVDLKISATRIRCHGDYHLGQVLFTGDDFAIIDFEGEPGRPLRDRRYKRSPFRDLASMLRSFDYAAETALGSDRVRAEDRPRLLPLAAALSGWLSVAFVRQYLETAGSASFVPRSPDETRLLLDFFELEKVIYELSYELNSRPDWLHVPLNGLLRMLAANPDAA
jgi:maltose alpha-D-glucosyltransferase/alpha-amylase